MARHFHDRLYLLVFVGDIGKFFVVRLRHFDKDIIHDQMLNIGKAGGQILAFAYDI